MELDALLASQDEVVAAWQLRLSGWDARRVARTARDPAWQRVHDGVFAVQRAPLRPKQRWRAAGLTTPTSVLSHETEAARLELRMHAGRLQSITRPGDQGLWRGDGLVVRHSGTLRGDVRRHDGMWVTTPERTVLDLWPLLGDVARRKLLREALRRRRVTGASMAATLDRHPGRRGTRTLRASVVRLARLQLERCRSDAEAYAMELLDEHRRPLPIVNARWAGEEADLAWEPLRLIIELDGPQWHRDKEDDARKTAVWTLAGWTVRRLDTDVLFARPSSLLELAPRLADMRRAQASRSAPTVDLWSPGVQ